PSMFYQLYTLHGNYHDFTFPLVYVLSTTKNQNFYRRMLSKLNEHAAATNRVLAPQYVHSDFEIAFMNASREVFPNCIIHGCLFHFTQSIWRQVVNRGLKVAYSDNEKIKSKIQSILALPFVPLDDVETVFNLIIESPNEDEDEEFEMDELLNFI